MGFFLCFALFIYRHSLGLQPHLNFTVLMPDRFLLLPDLLLQNELLPAGEQHSHQNQT